MIPQNRTQSNPTVPPLVTIRRIYPMQNSGNLRALVDVQVGAWNIRGCRIVQQPGRRAYAQFPHQQSPTNGRWYPAVRCNDKTLAKTVLDAVLVAWLEEQSKALAPQPQGVAS